MPPPWSSNWVARSVQLPSAEENSVNETSMAVIWDLLISNLRLNSRQRSVSAASAAEMALNATRSAEHRNTAWRCKAVSPDGPLSLKLPMPSG